jgi:hypothetical protein
MTVCNNGVGVKHFQDRIETTPYKIISIQVDEGSRVTAELESECENLEITLEVLPPSKPTYNGGV